jgi:carbon monoxide dehydrogenase subunit G
MEIENTFTVAAAPDTVYAYLLDVNQVVGCVPGAQLSEVVDPATFRGKVRIKVGPVTVTYDGTARIAERDEASRTATIRAEGRETAGQGSAQATTTMSVTPEGEGSLVRFATDFSVVGRVAQFGRGIMEDVSRRIVDQMATCIRQRLESEGATTVPSSNGAAPPPEAGVESSTEPVPSAAPTTAQTPAPAAEATSASGAAPEPVALDAIALARGVALDRLRRLRVEAVVAAAAALLVLTALRRRLRGRRRPS